MHPLSTWPLMWTAAVELDVAVDADPSSTSTLTFGHDFLTDGPRPANVADPGGAMPSKARPRAARRPRVVKGASTAARPRSAGKRGTSTVIRRKRPTTAKPVLLGGGNPQIAKADGDAPVQAYIAAMPGWKRGVGKQLDALIERAVPGVAKAVKWN